MKLVDVLTPELIRCPLTGTSRESVIQELINCLAEDGLIDDGREVLQAVLEREKIMTTGVGNGVAIPHCKTNKCSDFAVALGIHETGVDFQSLDKQPAHIIFLLVGPENKPAAHIRLLSRISRIISKPSVREALLACKSPAEIYKFLQEEEANSFEMTH